MAASPGAAERVLGAIHAVYAQDTPPDERLRAQSLLESFQQDPQSVHAAINLFRGYAGPQPLAARHFALLCLENAITMRWNQLGEPQRDHLKNVSLELLAGGSHALSDAPLIRNKLAVLVSAIATRDWPQRWSGLMSELFAIARKSESTKQLVLFVLRNLSDEVLDFDPRLPEQRRREIKQTLLAGMNDIVQFVMGILAPHLAALKSEPANPTHGLLVRNAIEALTSLFQFAPADLAFSVLPPICHALSLQPLFLETAELVLVIARRRTATVSPSMHPQILKLWEITLSMARSIMNAKFPQQHEFLAKMLDIVAAMLRFHHELLAAPAASALRQSLFAVELDALATPVLSVTHKALDMIVFALRNTGNALVTDDMRADFAGKVLSILLVRAMKAPDDPDAADNPDAAERDDEAANEFGNYRSTTQNCVELLVQRAPNVCLAVVHSRYKQVLSALPDDFLNDRGYATLATTRYRELETVGNILDAVMRHLPVPALQTLAPAAADTLRLVLSYNPGDPNLICRQLHALSLFSPLYALDRSYLMPALKRLFDGVVFRDPKDPPDAPPWELHEDVMAARRRACYSLVHIGRYCPQALLPMLKDLTSRVQGLIREHLVSDTEKMLLFEMLVSATNAMSDVAAQTSFVSQMLHDVLAQWSSEAVGTVLRDHSQFMSLVTPGAATENVVAARRGIRDCVNTFFSVFRRVPLQSPDKTRTHPVSQLLLERVVPNTCVLLAMLNSLWSPQVASTLPPGMRGILQTEMLETNEVLGDFPRRADLRSDPVFPVQWWLTSTRDLCYFLLGHAVTMGAPFYQRFSPEMLTRTIFSNATHQHPRNLRMMLDKFLLPFLRGCPPSAFQTVLLPVFQGVTVTMASRLPEEWRRAVGAGSDGGGEGAAAGGGPRGQELREILSDKHVRVLTRSYTDLVLKVMRVPDGAAGMSRGASGGGSGGGGGGGGGEDEDGPAAPAPSAESTLVCEFILAHAALFAPLMRSLVGCVFFPDSLARARACAAMFRLAGLAAERNMQVALPFFAEALNAAVVSLARHNPNQPELPNDLVGLVKEIYTRLGRISPMPRSVLLEVPGITPAHLDALEQALSAPLADRKHRKIVKDFLAHLIVGRFSEFAASAKRIANLPEVLLAPQSFAVHPGADWSQNLDPVALTNLFASPSRRFG